MISLFLLTVSICEVLVICNSNRYKLAKSIITTTRDANFYSNRIVNIWNDLPDSIVMASTVSLFKRRLRNFDFSAYIIY
jgi:hypothetical protein